MSNMNYLTLELSQGTDSKVLSSNSVGYEKESSSVFSNLMEQHKASKKSGNNAAKAGNEEQNQIRDNNNSENIAEAEKKNSENNTEIKSPKSDAENLSTDTTDSSETDLYTQAQLNKTEAAEAKNENSSELLLDSSGTSDDANLFTNPEQLLSFLNASEKALSGKDGTSSEDAEKNPVTPVVPITSGAGIASKTDKVLVEQATSQVTSKELVEPKTGEELSLKTDKTLIAQSLSKQKDESDLDVINKVNELLKSKSSESSDEIINNKELGSNKSADITKLSGLQEALGEGSKDVISEEELTSSTKAKLESSIDKITNGVQLSGEVVETLDEQVTSSSTKANSESSIGKITNGVQLSDEAVETLDEEATSLANKALTNEQILTQLKSQNTEQAINKEATKTDSKTTILNNAQDLAKSSSADLTDTQEAEQLDTAKSDSKESQFNGINQAAFKPEQVNLKNKDSVQASVADSLSDKSVDSSDEAEASELAKDELLMSEAKSTSSPLNNVANNTKLNQAINPLFDTLSQTEANDAADSERYMQDEHSFENVMQTLSADLAQTQKNTVIQQAETISIMRKDFTDAVKDKVMVMINQKIQQIDIQLDPPELGSMQVRINMQNEQAVVSFVVQNQQAKEALEQNMDRLRHMMADNGVDVGDANVKQDSNQSAMNGESNQGSAAQGENGEEGALEGAMNSENAKVLKASSTGVDYYV
ncbi:flagellar hook-length control protein FliK [Pseudocolwellia sp. AS88]|uniref:flagellar hook-length control protein FliK n=1 Tax=Pseudocolwellia sp. AS88 TaxID=3063958 RepID=UPI0026EA2956|nr:flagellar hook-length control protein FliK [Pseudocolwellia sp. AS88]MDO7085060.1 flagellar hook-length control protein FliK [Pseudocolwellia sp. AS88]